MGLDFFFPFELNLVKGYCQQRPLIGQRFFSEKTRRDIYTIGEKRIPDAKFFTVVERAIVQVQSI